MDGQQLAFGLCLSVVACLGGGWWCLRRLHQARLLADTPTSKIRSAAQGYVELSGRLLEQPEAAIVAPLSGRPCLWWRFRIEEYSGSGKSRRYRLVESGCSEAWLRLADATGECLIDPRGADVRPASRDVWYGDTPRPLWNRRAPTGFSLLTMLGGGGDYRYTEERFQAGEYLYAIGEFRTLGGGGQAFDPAVAQGAVIREWKRDYVGLLQRFDADGNGELDGQEWERVRRAAEVEARQRQRESLALPARNQMGKPRESHPFILSSLGKDHLIPHFRWQALGGAALCIAGALATAWLLDGYFHPLVR